MPQRNSLISRLRHGRAWDEWDEGSDGGDAEQPDPPAPAPEAPTKPDSRRRRLAVTLTFAALFVAGAAFSATAGDQVRSVLQDQAANANAVSTTDTTATGTTTPASTGTTPPASSGPAPSAAPSTDAAPPAEAPSDPSATPSPASTPAPVAAAPAPSVAAKTAAPVAVAAKAVIQQAVTQSDAVAHAGQRVRRAQRVYARTMRAVARQHSFPKLPARAPAPELDGAPPGAATVWLNRALPDPTPPSLRLSPRFAAQLQSVSHREHVDWALLLGVLRAEGHTGSAPAGLVGLRQVAGRLGNLGAGDGGRWAAMFSLSNSISFADRAVALAHYYRAIGLLGLVDGLSAEKDALGQQLLSDPRVSIYAGGRGDIQSGRVNVRVLAVIAYLAESFGQVTVSCLISGHRLYARPGVISAHIYGLAADISELGGTPISGHQQPGGVTEHAVRDILLLPPEMMPKQVISLLGLGGPSFPLADHYNHIHIGY